MAVQQKNRERECGEIEKQETCFLLFPNKITLSFPLVAFSECQGMVYSLLIGQGEGGREVEGRKRRGRTSYPGNSSRPLETGRGGRLQRPSNLHILF